MAFGSWNPKNSARKLLHPVVRLAPTRLDPQSRPHGMDSKQTDTEASSRAEMSEVPVRLRS